MLLQLLNDNYLTKIKYYEYTIYQPNITMIHETIQTFNYITIVKEILNVTEYTYTTTPLFYKVIIFVCFNQDCNAFWEGTNGS